MLNLNLQLILNLVLVTLLRRGGFLVLLIALCVIIAMGMLNILTRSIGGINLFMMLLLVLNLLVGRLLGLNWGNLVRILSNYACEVHFEFNLGGDPECPINQFKELPFEKIHLLQGDAAHECQEMVTIKHIIVKF